MNNDNHTTPVLQVDSLNVYYGSFQAVRNVSFEVRPGEIFGLLGPNGAGKTSTLSAVEGLLKPQSGNIHVAGYSILEQPLYARANMGVQLQATSFQPELTITEIIQLYAGIYGVDLSKEQQSSDWGAKDLTEKQLAYAANDVAYLHQLKTALDAMLAREGRTQLAQACFDFLPFRAKLDLGGWQAEDIFAHS